MFRDQVKFSFKWGIASFSVVAIFFISFLPACTTEKPVKGLLTEQEMVKVLTEIYLAEDKVGRVGISYDSIKDIFPKFETKVFEKMNVSDTVFQKSMEYYLAHPKKLEHIYTALIDSLNLKAQSAA